MEEQISEQELVNKNISKYSREIARRVNFDTKADNFCGYYFACGFNGCQSGELLAVLCGPRLKPVSDRKGNKIIYPELTGMSARVKEGKITELYFE